MNKEFIPYKQALALKELGFDELSLGWYDEGGNLYTEMTEYLKAPLYQQALRWFREKHDLQSSTIMFSNGKYDTGITRYKGTQSVWGYGPIYNAFEEAEQACLEQLIKLVKK